MDKIATQSHFSAIPWTWRDVLVGILVAGVGILGLNLVLLALIFLTRIPLRDAEHSDVLSLFIIAQGLVLVGTVWLCGVGRYRRNRADQVAGQPADGTIRSDGSGWAQVGLRKFSIHFGCAWALFFLFASYFLRAVYVAIASGLGMQLGVQSILTRLDTAGVGFILTLLVGAVVAPLAEEVFFRGFMYGGLRARLGVPAAVLITSVFFAALHLDIQFFLPILILGIFLALLYEMTGSLYPGMILHVGNNLIALIVYFVARAMGVPLTS